MGIKVSGLVEYPLKSGKGNPITTADVMPTGFDHDRIAMLVHAEGPQKGTFISQRTKGCESLTGVETKVSNKYNGFKFSFSMINGVSFDVTVDPDLEYENLENVKVWASECKGIDAGDEAAYYFSEYLNIPVRLVIYPHSRRRMVDPNYSQPGDVTSYADGFPFLITSAPSFVSLREHFADGTRVHHENFRPNIVLDGSLPFEEDRMHLVRIGPEVELEIVKPCARCVMTTINQFTGEREDKELLATLTKLRRGKGEGLQGVFFGQNAVPRKLGTIIVGDEVEVLSTRPLHPALEQAVLKYGI